jgi:hypothetical protein
MDGMGGDEELELMAAMGAIPQEQALLQQRMRRAQGLMDTPLPQGQQIGRVYKAASPLEALASAMMRGLGGRDMRRAEQDYGALAQRAQQGQLAAARRQQEIQDRDFGLKSRAADLNDAQAMAKESDSAAAYTRWEREQAERERSNRAREKLLATPKSGGGHGAFLPPDDTEAIADAIARGDLPPALTPYRSNASAVAAALARRGINVSEQQMNFDAEKKAISSLNSTQQVRLRQTMGTLDHSLDKLDEVYKKWTQVGPKSGFRTLNRAALAAAQQMPGETGAVAQELTTLINDLTAETAQIYMGGNSPTDHALKLASENLKADWNDETFKRLLGLMRTQLKFRRQAMGEIRASGTRGDNQYAPPAPVTDAAPSMAPAAQDAEAKAWADANPNDPRAAAILQRLKAKGL